MVRKGEEQRRVSDTQGACARMMCERLRTWIWGWRGAMKGNLVWSPGYRESKVIEVWVEVFQEEEWVSA